jgi:hypothetical protein
MDQINQAVNSLLHLFAQLADIVLGALTAIEAWLRGALQQAGIAGPLQTAILVAVAVILLIAVLRAFGGVLRVLLMLFLILLAAHAVLPAIHS